MRQFAIAMAVLCLASPAHAQRRGPVVIRANVETETVKGAPYSAEIVNESTQTLSDGNRISRRTTSRVYRDSEGRTRREEDRPWGSPAITITDPVAGSSFWLDVDNRVARQSPAMPRIFTYAPYNAGFGQSVEFEKLNVAVNGVATGFNVVRLPDGRGGAASSTQHVEERLAPRTIEGVRVDGVRKTMTIPAGAIGNERPIVVTSEEWMSPDLKALVWSESNDPRSGTSTYKLVNLRRGDPPSWFFQVPGDYTTVQAPIPPVPPISPVPGFPGARGGRK